MICSSVKRLCLIACPPRAFIPWRTLIYTGTVFGGQVKDKEAKYFLTQFCHLYYRRNRYTINDDFTKSLYFLDGKLANEIMVAYKKNKVIENFLDNSAAPDVD